MTFKLLALLFAAALPAYRVALPGYRYQFPRDHFAHPDFRTEWWYYTGNLRSDDGHRWGFELVFFRQGNREHAGDNPSAWRAGDLYLAHLALSDIDGDRFVESNTLNTAGPGIAGASLEEARVWNGNWQARWDLATSTQTLTATAEGIRFDLRLKPRTAPVIHGENGVSQKAPGPGKASCYVSFPLLQVSGTLNGAAVRGQAWMDHEWFTHQLEANQQGWDWFSIQLENHTELMLFQLRTTDGGISPYSSGTYIDASGRAHHLRRADFTLAPVDYWRSARTGARYPVHWKIAVPSLGLGLDCRAAMPNQELVPEQKGGPAYWEGAVTYSGTARGVGYLEMTGYSGRVAL